VGDRVMCNVGQWEIGEIVAIWYREAYWETGRYSPYQVLLDEGSLIHVPRDTP